MFLSTTNKNVRIYAVKLKNWLRKSIKYFLVAALELKFLSTQRIQTFSLTISSFFLSAAAAAGAVIRISTVINVLIAQKHVNNSLLVTTAAVVVIIIASTIGDPFHVADRKWVKIVVLIIIKELSVINFN